MELRSAERPLNHVSPVWPWKVVKSVKVVPSVLYWNRTNSEDELLCRWSHET
jgi:hypothetical protein